MKPGSQYPTPYLQNQYKKIEEISQTTAQNTKSETATIQSILNASFKVSIKTPKTPHPVICLMKKNQTWHLKARGAIVTHEQQA